MNDASIILADEPTGALDSRSGDEALSILSKLTSDGRTIIIVAHDFKAATRTRRIIEISDCRNIADRPSPPQGAPTVRAPVAKAPAALPGSAFFEALRIAGDARRSDILEKFLIEAVLVCMIGGVLGIGAALGSHLIFAGLNASFTMIQSPNAMIAALVSAALIGITFGFLPARSASRMDPVAALSKG